MPPDSVTQQHELRTIDSRGRSHRESLPLVAFLQRAFRPWGTDGWAWLPNNHLVMDILKRGKRIGPGCRLEWSKAVAASVSASHIDHARAWFRSCPEYIDTIEKWEVWQRSCGCSKAFDEALPLEKRLHELSEIPITQTQSTAEVMATIKETGEISARLGQVYANARTRPSDAGDA
jgi:hypothetical protein